jgi:hypothetical protein
VEILFFLIFFTASSVVIKNISDTNLQISLVHWKVFLNNFLYEDKKYDEADRRRQA